MTRNLLATIFTLALMPVAQAGNWMSRLPDNAYVSVLSIPGAHDAATGSGWAEGAEDMGNTYAKTQDLDIATLWSLGVRAFDLRPSVYETHMNLNHGLIPTAVTFEQVLGQLCDSLRANPTEFVIVHMLHETDGDQIEDAYDSRIVQLLTSEAYKDFLADFKSDLSVGDMRGKMLILSRDKYATTPVTGGFFDKWTGSLDWSRQIAGRIINKNGTATRMYVQDYSDTHGSGGVANKVQGIRKMLDFSTKHQTAKRTDIRWVFNFASAYSMVQSLLGFDISLSDGYRDNATHTHAAIIDYLAENAAGPTGIILMDFAGTDQSGDYHTRGGELVNALIENNFRYLEGGPTAVTPLPASPRADTAAYGLDGRPAANTARSPLLLQRNSDGTVKKRFAQLRGGKGVTGVQGAKDNSPAP